MNVLIEAVAFLELVFLLSAICLRYRALPERLHPFLNGGTGNKSELWALMAIATFLYLLMTGVSRIPDLPVNLPGSPGPEAVADVRGLARSLLLRMKLVLMGMFLAVAMNATQPWQPPAFRITLSALSACLLIVIAAFLFRIFRTTRGVAE